MMHTPLISRIISCYDSVFVFFTCVGVWISAGLVTSSPMTSQRLLLYGFGFILASVLIFTQVDSLQCYGCNVFHGQKYVDVGCSSPEIITCTLSHKGFKHRFCIKTESTALGIVLTSGCATSRHCQQHELPGVRIHCCDSDLCNSAPNWRTNIILMLTFIIWMCI